MQRILTIEARARVLASSGEIRGGRGVETAVGVVEAGFAATGFLATVLGVVVDGWEGVEVDREGDCVTGVVAVVASGVSS